MGLDPLIPLYGKGLDSYRVYHFETSGPLNYIIWEAPGAYIIYCVDDVDDVSDRG